MTLERFEQRLADLNKQRDKALSQMIAVDGAIQECQYWISQAKVIPVNFAPVPAPGCDMPVKTVESGTERSDGPDKEASTEKTLPYEFEDTYPPF